MEVLNQLFSNRIDYINALRTAQEMPIAPPPDPGNSTKFKFNGKLIVRILTAAGIFYVGYLIYKSFTIEPFDEEE
jgi:hypothetical protein